MRIDSHHHFWNYSAEQYPWISDEMSVLKRDFLAADLAATTAAVGIDGVISVQARQTIQETEWLIELAESSDLVRGVVGWVPLAAESVDEVLEGFQSSKILKGVRHVVQDEPDDQFILGAEFNRGVAKLADYGLVYDILIFAKHLAPSIEFVDRHPNQAFVLDHIAKPTIVTEEFDQRWAEQIRELAKRENVCCKFSGVATEVRDDQWSIETVRPYWDVALEAFGAGRLMFGSDWPVCLLRTSYERWHSTVRELASPLSPSEQAAFWGGNATKVYKLSR